MAAILFGKIFCLFIAISYTTPILARVYYKQAINGWTIGLMAAGWTGFITLMWLI